MDANGRSGSPQRRPRGSLRCSHGRTHARERNDPGPGPHPARPDRAADFRGDFREQLGLECVQARRPAPSPSHGTRSGRHPRGRPARRHGIQPIRFGRAWAVFVVGARACRGESSPHGPPGGPTATVSGPSRRGDVDARAHRACPGGSGGSRPQRRPEPIVLVAATPALSPAAHAAARSAARRGAHPAGTSHARTSPRQRRIAFHAGPRGESPANLREDGFGLQPASRT